jgi:hypothetical protein
MGMDIEGIKPSSEDGEYIRFSVWSWRPICEMMLDIIERENLTSKFKEPTILEYWHSNDGEGLKNQEDCNILADALQPYFDSMVGNNIMLNSGPQFQVEKLTGAFAHKEDVLKEPIRFESPYKTTKEHFEEWLKFLRSCGGFEIH